MYQARYAMGDDDGDAAAGLPQLGSNQERFWYRAERCKRFSCNKHFPALVSPRVVPTYRMRLATMGPEATTTTTTTKGARSTLLQSTAAAHLREMSRSKLGEDGRVLPFVPSGRSEASALICDRKNALFDNAFDAKHEKEQ